MRSCVIIPPPGTKTEECSPHPGLQANLLQTSLLTLRPALRLSTLFHRLLPFSSTSIVALYPPSLSNRRLLRFLPRVSFFGHTVFISSTLILYYLRSRAGRLHFPVSILYYFRRLEQRLFFSTSTIRDSLGSSPMPPSSECRDAPRSGSFRHPYGSVGVSLVTFFI